MDDIEFTEEIEQWIKENTIGYEESSLSEKPPDEEDEEETSLERLRGGDTPAPRINNGTVSMIKVIFTIAGLILVGMLAAYIFFHPVIVSGPSMEPTLHNGEILRTSISITPPDLRRGTIIYFQKENEKGTLIKRIIGLPGETISFKEGYIYIDGNKWEDEFGIMNEYPETTVTLGEDEYYCLGDNRNNSRDSRAFGPVRYSEIKGMASSEFLNDIKTIKENLFVVPEDQTTEK
jgi:signal peptidase I, bacterial type